MSLFGKRDLVKPSFFNKIFKTLPKENFIIELQNLLDDNSNDFTAIARNAVSDLKEKYKISSTDFEREREYFLRQYIQQCIYDKHLSDYEKKQLEYLDELLGLDKKLLWKQIREEGEAIYREKVKSVIIDDKITGEEQKELDLLQKEFDLSDYDSGRIRSSEVNDKIQKYVDELLSQRRVSPDDEKRLNDMIKNTHANVGFLADELEKFKTLWKIENGELEPIPSPIALQKNENLFYSARIDWYEERSRTTYVSYSGLTYRFRITKGLSFRVGGIAPSRQTEQYMKLIDSGTVFFTNKRIIFTGDHGNKTIPLSKILDITPFSNGIEIGKDTGKKPFFECADPELMGLYIVRLLNDL